MDLFTFILLWIEIPVSKNSVDPDQICTVCLCPNNVTLGIRGLIDGMATTDCAFNQFNYTKGNNLCYHHDILSVEVFSQKSLRSKPDWNNNRNMNSNVIQKWNILVLCCLLSATIWPTYFLELINKMLPRFAESYKIINSGLLITKLWCGLLWDDNHEFTAFLFYRLLHDY